MFVAKQAMKRREIQRIALMAVGNCVTTKGCSDCDVSKRRFSAASASVYFTFTCTGVLSFRRVSSEPVGVGRSCSLGTNTGLDFAGAGALFRERCTATTVDESFFL